MTIKIIAIVILVGVVVCGVYFWKNTQQKESISTQESTGNKVLPSAPSLENLYEQGPLIDEKLIAWLDKNADGRTLQLPIERHATGSFIRSGDTKIKLNLLDLTSMGIEMQSRQYCEELSCRVWLKGSWGARFPVPSLVSDEALPVFTVTGFAVTGLVEGEPSHIRISK